MDLWDPAAGGGAGAWDAAPDVWKRWVYYDWLPIVEFDAVASGGAIGTGNGTMNVSMAGLSGSLNSIKEAGGTTMKRCLGCAWRVSASCEFGFEAFDKYNFVGGGEPYDPPGIGGTIEDILMSTVVLHWSWSADASGVLESTCEDERVPPGGGASW